MKTTTTLRRARPALLAAALLVAGTAFAGDGKFYDFPARYKEECGSCHIAYPAQLMARDSWRALMGALDKHRIDDATRKDVLAILYSLKGEIIRV